jgi:WD40 repeat protein
VSNPNPSKKHAQRPVPYVGPRAFRRGEPFYGREREIEELAHLLIAERIILLYSPSGAGKTSLIHAGLIPRLERKKFLVLPSMRVTYEPPPGVTLPAESNRYILSLLLSLDQQLPSEQQRPIEDLATLSLLDYLEQIDHTNRKHPDLVLIFDQFEEILAVDPAHLDDQRAFFAQAGQVLEHPQYWALFAMREEYLAGLDPFARHIPNRFQDRFRLELLSVSAARAAIQKPAQHAGVDFTDAAVTRLIDDLRRVMLQQPDGRLHEHHGTSIEPVHLQVVCLRLWKQLPADTSQIVETDIETVGDVTSALAEYYALQVQQCSSATNIHERFIRDWIEEQLITPQGIRRQVLQDSDASQGLDNRAIQFLQDVHLLRAEQQRGATWFELAHDRLIEPIRTNNSAWREHHLSKMQRHAALWEQENRPDGLLLHDDELAAAEAWATTTIAPLTPVEHDFLEKCRASQAILNQQRRNRRIIRTLLASATVLAILALLAMWVTVQARTEAAERAYQIQTVQAQRVDELETSVARGKRIEEEHENALTSQAIALATQAESFLAEVPDRAHLLAIEAAKRAQTPRVESTLRRTTRTMQANNTVLFVHSESAIAGTFSPDGQRIALAAAGNPTVTKILNADTARMHLVLAGHEDTVMSVAYSPDGQRLVTASVDSTARTWDANSGVELAVLRGHTGAVIDATYSPDGQRIATAGADGTVRIWDAGTSEPLLTLEGHEEIIYSVAYSPNGQRIVTAGVDGTARVWHANTGEQLLLLDGHEGSVYTATYSPDGQNIVTAGDDGITRVWHATSGAEHMRLDGHDGVVWSSTFSPDGHRIMTTGNDATLRLWSAHTGTEVYRINLPYQPIENAIFSPDGDTLLTTSIVGDVRLWNIAYDTVLEGHEQPVTSAAVSSDGQYAATASSDGTARLWLLDEMVDVQVLRQHDESITDVSFNPNGHHLLTASRDATAHLWNTTTGEELAVLDTHSEAVNSAAFNPDGQHIVTASDDHTVRLWSTNPLSMVHILRGHTDAVFHATFSPDGKTIVSCGDDATIRFWDVASGTQQRAIDAPPEGARRVTFRPDGEHIVIATGSNTARVWDADSGKEVLVLQGHEDSVVDARYSPDGKRIITASWDHTARIWDAETGNAIVVLDTHNDSLTGAFYSPDGQYIVTTSVDNTAHIHYANFADVLALAEKIRPRALTQEEREIYLGMQ